MDTAHWPQEIVVKPMEEIVVVPATGSNNNNTTTTCSSVSKAASLERRVRPQKEQALNCPRCNSTNTKFCYYNNYSLSQPRYFCKTCRRYWTEGGSLRNIPVGGGSRKNKKSSSSSSSTTTTSTITSSKKLIQLPHDHHHQLVHLPPPISSFQNSKNCEGQGQDLNLGFPSAQIHDFKTISDLIQVPNYDDNSNNNNNNNNSSSKMNPNSSSHHHHLSALELLTGFSTSTGTTSRGLSSFMPMAVSDPNGIYSSGFSHMQEFKPSLNFSLDGNFGSSGDGGGYGMQETSGSGRVLFPFEDLKQVSSSSDIEQNRGGDHQAGDSTGYWNGVLGGGSW